MSTILERYRQELYRSTVDLRSLRDMVAEAAPTRSINDIGFKAVVGAFCMGLLFYYAITSVPRTLSNQRGYR